MRILALIFTCLTTTLLKAQINNFNQSPVTFLSPDATQFIRYGNIPVDYSTGVPGISIPLYNITSGNLSLPIDISYNSSGIKVLDIASTVGLGWSINAGGLISRTVLGTNDQDDKQKPYLSSTDVDNAFTYCRNNLTYNNVQDLVETISNIFVQNSAQKESQSDRFFYSFSGRSGIFRTDFQTGVAKTVPYSALKISTGINTAGPYTITSEDGTKYFFDQPELSGPLPGVPFYTSFYLTKIESADLTKVINIHYKQDAPVSQFIKSYQLQHKVIYNPIIGIPDQILTLPRDNEFINYSEPVMPDSITSDKESVLFEYIADRPDLRASRLLRIKILNRVTREIIKVIEFQHSYFGTSIANNRRLRLDNLYIKDNANTIGQQYNFSYNNTPLPPYYNQLGISEHHNVDYWGYYNGADNANLIPLEMFDPVRDPSTIGPTESYLTPQEKSFYGGNRNPNPSTAQACILTEITYPTGGKTSFEYELNKVANGYGYPYGEDYGGLRVKKITNTANADSPPIIKTYEYSQGLATMIESELYQYNTPGFLFVSTGGGTSVYSNTSSTISSDPLIQMSTGGNSLVLYNYIKEYDGTNNNNNGYTEYIYDNSSLSPYIFDPGSGGNPLQNGFYLSDYGNYKPQLKSKTIYGKDPSDNIKIVAKEEYFYDKFNTGSFITGVKIQRNYPFEKSGFPGSITDADIACSDGPGGSLCQVGLANLLGYYSYSNTLGILDVPLLTQKKLTTNPSEGTGSFVITTDYTYDLQTLQPIEEKVNNSKGEILISVNKYPTDFSSLAPYNTMVSQNILTPVIEQLTYKNSISSPNFLKSAKTNFDYWNGSNWSVTATNIIAKKTIDTKSKDQSVYETRQRFFSYDDKGNLTTIAKENDVKKTYLWGYNKIYPVAEIIGADYTTASSYISQTILDNPPADATFRNQLNNLRNIPGALVTTYTYKPLVGITSKTDPNGITTYYEYDNFNRLIVIKDKDNNVLKKICYNYAGQTGACSYYANEEQSMSFQKNNCTNGNIGSNVTYTVPQGRYGSTISLSDANSKALAELSQNGQTYANINGTCSAPPTVNMTASHSTSMIFYVTCMNTQTSIYYNFTINSTTAFQTLGQMPAGSYNVTITPAGGSGLYEWWVGDYYESGYHTLNLYGINITNDNDGFIEIFNDF